jgi:NAD(P)-dependent dehydrogenase (short-subunit alcohol dehydrogenase family)
MANSIQAIKPVTVIAGVGPGNGAALAQRFAASGHAVALLARSAAYVDSLAATTAGMYAFACDVSDPNAVQRTFQNIREQLGPVSSLLYNAGSGVFSDIDAVTAAQFEESWRINALGALLCAKQVIPDMTAASAGNIIFVGATASRRGGVNSAAFAPAKAAQRSLAESMARSLWPRGIHVALIIVDGIVDLPRTRARMPDKPDDDFVDPAGVADIAMNLAQQSRRAWSFEVEARPFREKW